MFSTFNVFSINQNAPDPKICQLKHAKSGKAAFSLVDDFVLCRPKVNCNNDYGVSNQLHSSKDACTLTSNNFKIKIWASASGPTMKLT